MITVLMRLLRRWAERGRWRSMRAHDRTGGRTVRLFVATLTSLCAAAVADARNQPLVWALHGPSNTVYIAGSMHLLRREDATLSDNLNRAYADAERLVMEVDMDDLDEAATSAWTAQHGRYDADSHMTLRTRLGDPLWQKLNALTEPAGLPLSAVNDFKPWLVGLTYTLLQLQKLGLDPELGVEEQLTRRARADHKPITGLETVPQQLTIFDSLADDLQRRFLEQTVEEAKDAPQELNSLASAWKNGDERALSRELLQEYARFPELYDALVWRRNQAWVPQIAALLHGKDDYLVVVGALHLVGDRGVIHLLQRAGLAPQRLTH